MYAFPNVMHLFTNELARLRARGLSLPLVFSGSIQSLLLRHDLPPDRIGSPLLIMLAQFPCRTQLIHAMFLDNHFMSTLASTSQLKVLSEEGERILLGCNDHRRECRKSAQI